MYSVTTYREPALLVAELNGRIAADELQSLSRDLDRRLLQAASPLPVLLLDVSRFEAAGDAVFAELERYVERTLEAGIRIGRVVETQLAAHQLDRVAEEGGRQEQIRHFHERAPALEWLRTGAA